MTRFILSFMAVLTVFSMAPVTFAKSLYCHLQDQIDTRNNVFRGEPYEDSNIPLLAGSNFRGVMVELKLPAQKITATGIYYADMSEVVLFLDDAKTGIQSVSSGAVSDQHYSYVNLVYSKGKKFNYDFRCELSDDTPASK